MGTDKGIFSQVNPAVLFKNVGPCAAKVSHIAALDIRRGGLWPQTPPLTPHGLPLQGGLEAGQSVIRGSSRRVIRRALGGGRLTGFFLFVLREREEAGPPGVPGLLGQQVTTVFQFSSLATLLSD